MFVDMSFLNTFTVYRVAMCITNFAITSSVQRLQDDLQMLGMKIKGHEDNIKFLNAQNNKLDDLILDLQGIIFFFIFYF